MLLTHEKDFANELYQIWKYAPKRLKIGFLGVASVALICLMNDTSAEDMVYQVWEFAPQEVKLGLVGIAGVASIALYGKKNVAKIFAHGESALKTSVAGLYSFFKTKKNDRNSVQLAKAHDEYAQLVPVMYDELELLLLAVIEKQHGKCDLDVVKLIQTLRVDIADYPEVSSGMLADEVEQVINARKKHHQKILLDITHYLESSAVDETTQFYNNRKEI